MRPFAHPSEVAPAPEPDLGAGERSRRRPRAGDAAARGAGCGPGAPWAAEAVRSLRAESGGLPGSSGAAPWGPEVRLSGTGCREGASGSSGARGVGGLRCSSGAPAAAEFGGERACAPGGGGVGTGAFWLLIFSQVEESRTEK